MMNTLREHIWLPCFVMHLRSDVNSKPIVSALAIIGKQWTRVVAVNVK
jgi:hypothetical protein